MELITLKETATARIYDFLEYDEQKQALIHRQLENRAGRIFVRTRISFSGTLSELEP